MHKLATYILMELLLQLIIEVREVYDYYKTKELEQWILNKIPNHMYR